MLFNLFHLIFQYFRRKTAKKINCPPVDALCAAIAVVECFSL